MCSASLADEAHVGLADILERGDLSRRDGERLFQAYRASVFDLEILDVADAAIGSRVPSAFLLPVPGANTAVLLATCILVDHSVRHRELTAQVALVTRQLRLRAFYDQLYFRREHLVEFFPRTLVTGSGPVDVGTRPPAYRDRPGRLHFLSSLTALTDVGSALDGVVVEAEAVEPREVEEALQRLGERVPFIYVATNPFDPVLDLLKDKGAVWGWDAAWLSYLLEGTSTRASLCAEIDRLRGACDTAFSVIAPQEGSTLDGNLADIWHDLVVVQHHAEGVTFDALKWVWAAFGALSHLAVPLAKYDQEARVSWGVTPLGEVAGKAAQFAQNAHNEDQREYWEVLSLDLADAVRSADSDNPKPELLAHWVSERSTARDSSVVITRNRAAKSATGRFLSETPGVPIGWRNSVDICTLSELRRGVYASSHTHALLTGPVPTRYSSLLALPAARELTVLSHGAWEGNRAVNQIRKTLERLADLSHGGVRQTALERLDLEIFSDGPKSPKPVRIDTTLKEVDSASGGETSPAVWDPFDIKVVGSLGASDPDSAGLISSAPGDTDEVSAIRIVFSDGIAFFEPDRLLTVVRDQTEEVAAKGLARGDRVLLVDRGGRRDLFDLVTDRLAELPEFVATVQLIREWQRRALLAGARHGFDYQTILDNMKPHTRITTSQTIRNWVLSWVKGPRNPREIGIFGRAVGDQILEAKWEPIGKALKTIRGHHKKIGKMLARVLSGVSPTDLEDSGYFDRRLGIHYSDLVEAVSVHRVVQVSSTPRLIAGQYANRLLTSSEARYLETTSDG